MGEKGGGACGSGLRGGAGGLLGGEEADARVVGGWFDGGCAEGEGGGYEAVFCGCEFYS